jgi:hypothetical protein
MFPMEKAKIKEIGNYLKELEEGLVEPVYNPASLQLQLPKLYQTIELLMDATFKAKGQKLKPLLASLGMRLRKCKQAIVKMVRHIAESWFVGWGPY